MKPGYVKYFFKLCRNIADPVEVEFARMELEGLFPAPLDPIANFVDVLSKSPLSSFCRDEARIQDVVTRDVCYGEVQGFQSVKDEPLIDVSDLVKRLAYTREIYVATESRENPQNILSKLYPSDNKTRNAQVFTLSEGPVPLHLFRIVVNTYFYENMEPVVFFSYAKEKEKQWDRIKKNVERLLKHVMDDPYYIPLHPGSRLGKEVEDLIDQRKEVKLYLSHALGPPYKAKFHPRMAKAMMNALGLKRGVLLDPFVGSGTMLIECTLSGVDSIGVDISPVCVQAARAKIAALTTPLQSLRQEIDGMIETAHRQKRRTEMIEKIVPSSVLSRYPSKRGELLSICLIKRSIEEVGDEGIRDIFLMTLSKVVSQAVRSKSKASVLPLFEKELEEVWKRALAFSKLGEEIAIRLGKAVVLQGDARRLSLPEESVQAVVTSPPYSTAVDYVKNDLPILETIHGVNVEKLEAAMIGNPRFRGDGRGLLDHIRTKEQRFKGIPREAQEKILDLLSHGRKNLALRQYRFLLDMAMAMKEIYRVLEPGCRCVVIIGNNHFRVGGRELEFRNAQYLCEMAVSEAGFERRRILHRTLLKTSYGAIKKEYLLILEKPQDTGSDRLR